ncbi:MULTISPECIES: hypothetical protein [Archaeoglobus]|nr:MULTISPECIES: hypothetical protein [Archaeoglobus]MDI3498358.1 hypothetical protein [Archaeoglobus sp.]
MAEKYGISKDDVLDAIEYAAKTMLRRKSGNMRKSKFLLDANI